MGVPEATAVASLRPLHFVIVGAGLGGLSAALALRRAGHRVTVLEQSNLASEHGAAINVAPNANGLLLRLGVHPAEVGAVELKSVIGYSKNGASVTRTDMAAMSKGWRHPYLLAHRVDLHSQLKSAATSIQGAGAPVELRTSSRVVDVDPETGTVTLADGAIVAGDAVIGADGVHSFTRSILTSVRPHPSGKSAYRFVVSKSDALQNPIVGDIVQGDGEFVFWFDEDRRVVMYPTRRNELWNFVCICPDHLWDDWDNPWDRPGRRDDLLSAYKGFDERALAFMRMADESTLKVWRLMDMEPVPNWCCERLALLGDAAHPFLPHQGQGGAQAIEDAASLGALFPLGVDASEVSSRLRLYQQCRKARAEKVQDLTRKSGQDIKASESEDKLTSISEAQNYISNHDEYDHSTEKLEQWQRHRESTTP